MAGEERLLEELGMMEKSRHVRVIEREKVRKDNPNEYFLPTGEEVLFESPRG